MQSHIADKIYREICAIVPKFDFGTIFFINWLGKHACKVPIAACSKNDVKIIGFK